MKKNQILLERFRQETGKVGSAFEAVAVICQYKIEAEEPLWDVLVEDFLKEDLDQIQIVTWRICLLAMVKVMKMKMNRFRVVKIVIDLFLFLIY